jgi:hypothetical protein
MKSEAVSVEHIVCRQCHAALDAADRFCRYCGAATEADTSPSGAGDSASLATPASVGVSAPAPRRAAKPAPAPPARWVIITLLMIGIGPLALPYLWRSPHFSRGGKIVWTVSTIIITLAAAWAIWYLLGKLIADFRELYFQLTH